MVRRPCREFTLSSLGLGPTTTPCFWCSAWMAPTRWLIHLEEMGEVKCALGILAGGENEYGHARYLYRAISRMPAARYIAMIGTQMRMLVGWIFISSDTRLVTSWS